MSAKPQNRHGDADGNTAKQRRIADFLGSYVVSLVVQQGEYWERVKQARQWWIITPVCQLPSLGSSDSVPARPDWPVPFGLLPRNLDFDVKVTPEGHPWAKVFAALAAYTPPRDALLEYRERLLMLLGFGSSPTSEHDEQVRPPDLPIRRMQDPITVEEWWRDYQTQLQTALSEQLRQVGVDLTPFWLAASDAARRALELTPEGRPDYGPLISYIDPTLATKAEVERALDWLADHGEMPLSATPVRPPRDPLTCVQCAILYDEEHWSHQGLARHFGWAVQHSAGQKPRSETARQHIVQGRRILRQEKATT